MEMLESTRVDEYRELIARLEAYEIPLSFSSLSQFSKSPRHFIEYKLKTFKPTPAMILGSLVDAMLLTPDELEEKFVKADCDVPTTDAQKGFSDEILLGSDPIQAYLNHYKPRSNKPESIQKAAAKKMAELEQYIEFCRENSGKEMIDPGTWEQAERIVNSVRKNNASRYLLNETNETQIPCNWEYGGFKWRGVRDAQGDDLVWDLKVTPDAHPRKFTWKAFDMLYHWQAAMYTNFCGMTSRYYIAAVDSAGNVSVHEITEGVRAVAVEEIKYMVQRLKRCIALGEWSKSYDFHAPNGIYQISSR